MAFDFFFVDFSTKIIALFLSVLLFLFVNIESATPINVDFKIIYRLPEGMVLTNEAPTLLHATLQGPWSGFRKLDPDSLQPVEIDLSRAGPGTLQYNIHDTDVQPPVGMRLLAMRPSELQLNIDRRVERLVPVNVDLSHEAAPGYEIGEIKIDPPKVRVVGPASKLQTLEFVSTKPIDVSQSHEAVQQRVELRTPLLPLKIVDKTVTVQIEINEQTAQRRVELPVHAPLGVVINPPRVTVVLKGPAKLLDNVKDVIVDVNPEAAEGLRHIEKMVILRPEHVAMHIEIVPPAPRVELQISEKKRHKK
jgi:YbbR domain-containing protein